MGCAPEPNRDDRFFNYRLCLALGGELELYRPDTPLLIRLFFER